MAKIILTADRTLMSDYSKNIFLGFAACAPKFIPGWLYTKIFCPPIEEENHKVKYAHCAQRKIESALLNNGFKQKDISIIRPERLGETVTNETKVLCITTHDPLGLGPASSTFSDLGGREPFTSYYFRKLITDPTIHRHNLTVLVGGSGSWQLTDERIIKKFGIDTVVIGEGEKTAVDLIEKALNKDYLPSIVQGELVPQEDIPLIQKPTIDGLIEIGRGCGRGCRFCNPTMLNYRCLPLDYILKEAKINVDAGNGVTLHAEDVLRYDCKGFIPNEQSVIKLFTEIKKLTDNIGISHVAHASVATKPKLVERISEIINDRPRESSFISAQFGLETGSPKLIEKYMRGKVKPFKPEDWPNIIIDNHKLFSDNKWIPVETLIMGLPNETTDDVQKTIDLIDEIKNYTSIIVPLYFVPIGNLNESRFYRTKYNKPEHWKLLAITIKHTINSSYRILNESPPNDLSGWKIWVLKRIVKYMEKRIDPYLKIMNEGISPFEYKPR
jgi:radical SAM superfamily enzyme YgiQ (UPF0313 family)